MNLYKLIDEKNNKYLKISVNSEDGGYNYFYGQKNQKGIYVYFKKVERVKQDNFICEKSTILGNDNNFKVNVMVLKRLSQKKLINVFNKISKIQGTLFSLYLEDKNKEIYDLLKKEV